MSVGPSLRAAMFDWLDATENLVTRSDTAGLAGLARTKLVRSTRAWRTLLAAHEPGENGRCPTCPRSRWTRRGRDDRCAVWVLAHELLIKADLSAAHDERFAIDANDGHETGGPVWSTTTTVNSQT